MIRYGDLHPYLRDAIRQAKAGTHVIYRFTGLHAIPSYCHLTLVVPETAGDVTGRAVVLSHPNGASFGTSVTNGVELILEQLYAQGFLGGTRHNAMVVERVPANGDVPAQWAYVEFDLDRDRFEHPHWTPIDDVP